LIGKEISPSSELETQMVQPVVSYYTDHTIPGAGGSISLSVTLLHSANHLLMTNSKADYKA